MKKIISAFFFLLCLGFTCFSQSFSLTDSAGSLHNGTDVFQSGPSDTLQLITWLNITNHSGNTLRVMMKKEEIQMLPGGSSSICWGGYCYGPEMMVSSVPLVMLPGETASGCFGHFGPNGCRGVSIIRWTFFNDFDPTDSLSITVHYSTFPSGVGDIPAPLYSISAAGPVPADDQIVIRYSLPPAKTGRIEFRNISGRLFSGSGTVVLAGTTAFMTAELPSGLYFCTLVVDGNPVATRKIAVRH